MIVNYDVHALLKKYLVEDYTNRTFIEMEDKSTVNDLIEMLDLPLKRVKLVFINGRQCKKNALLSEGDLVKLMPFVVGG